MKRTQLNRSTASERATFWPILLAGKLPLAKEFLLLGSD
jgi:hypothetical protein